MPGRADMPLLQWAEPAAAQSEFGLHGGWFCAK